MTANEGANVFEPDQVVRLVEDTGGFSAGTTGTVLNALPDHDLYEIEITDTRGFTLGLVQCSAKMLELAEA